MKKFKNIITGHSLDEYNKKYHYKKSKLLVYSKEQVEDYDKKHGFFEKTIISGKESLNYHYYLLSKRKWWLIEDKFYEIPKAPRFIWFRNLHIASQIAIIGLGICLIGTSIAVPLIVSKINANKFDVNATIDDSKKDKISILKKEVTESTGDINYYLKVSEGKCIESIAVRSDIYELIENTDFVFEQFENKVTFKKSSADRIAKNVTIYPSLTESAKKAVNKQQWLAAYKKYSDKYQNSAKQYKSDKIVVKYNNEATKLYDIPFLIDKEDYKESSIRFISGSNLLTSPLAGGNYCYEYIDSKFLQLKELSYDIEYSLENNHASFACKDKSSGEIKQSYTFNCNGYFEQVVINDVSSPYTISIEYSESPTEDIDYCFTAHGTTNPTTQPQTGKYCDYQSFYTKNNADFMINFKSGKKYKLYTSIRVFNITYSSTVYNCKFKISDICFTNVYYIKNYINNVEASVNGTNIEVNFDNESINSLNLGGQEVANLNDLFVFEFECIQDFTSYIKFAGTMDVLS